jgi:hypothetical protein
VSKPGRWRGECVRGEGKLRDINTHQDAHHLRFVLYACPQTVPESVLEQESGRPKSKMEPFVPFCNIARQALKLEPFGTGITGVCHWVVRASAGSKSWIPGRSVRRLFVASHPKPCRVKKLHHASMLKTPCFFLRCCSVPLCLSPTVRGNPYLQLLYSHVKHLFVLYPPPPADHVVQPT